MNQLYLFATILSSFILRANTYSYKDAKNWGKEYPKCDGKNQSPIIMRPDYNRESIEGYPSIPQTLKLTNFHKSPTKMTLNNTGHTVEIKADWSGEPPSASGGPLPHGKYVFEKAAFRWGKKNGGEHKVYEYEVKEVHPEAMEMHLYFYKEEFKSFEKAESQKGGLAVFVKWLEVLEKGSFEENKEYFPDYENLLGKLEKNLKKVRKINSTAVIPPFVLTSYIYFDLAVKELMFYEGSLDSPPCSESVTWFIDQAGTLITKNLLNEFRKIKLAEGDVSNIRPTQPLNNREVKIVYYH